MKLIARRAAVVAAVAILAGAGSTALAQRRQGGGDPKRMVDRQIEAMKESLSLNSEQEAKVRPILEESTKKNIALREKFGPPEEGQRPSREMMEEMRKIREETREKLGEVLTADQMKKYAEMAQGRQGAGGRGQKKRQQ
jgi:ERCC4-type nuclease